MCNVLDTDSNNAHLTIAQFDGEAMSSVLIICQPVVATGCENPLYDILWYWGTPPYVACGPNHFRLRQAVAL